MQMEVKIIVVKEEEEVGARQGSVELGDGDKDGVVSGVEDKGR